MATEIPNVGVAIIAYIVVTRSPTLLTHSEGMSGLARCNPLVKSKRTVTDVHQERQSRRLNTVNGYIRNAGAL